MKTLTFNGNYETIGRAHGIQDINTILGHPGCYAASPEFALEHCSPLTKVFLDCVSSEWYDECKSLGMLPNIDVRPHRLNIGEYPGVPGFHTDGMPRTTYHSQPDSERIPVRKTVLGFFSTAENVSRTKVIKDDFVIDEALIDPERYWSSVNQEVMKREVDTVEIEEGHFVNLDELCLHSISECKVRGARLFFRMSMWHNGYLGEQGKIAHQQQVYVDVNKAGW